MALPHPVIPKRSKDRWFEGGVLLLLQFFEGNIVSLSSLFLSLELLKLRRVNGRLDERCRPMGMDVW